MPRKIFVTTALPYANGPFHIGHIMEYIQADIWVRFQRMQGHELHFVCADDAHGAPIMLKAEAEGITPRELVTRIGAARPPYLQGFHIGFDHWHSTDSPENVELSQDVFRRLQAAGLVYVKPVEQYYDPVKGMFLADRYIKGECPNCHSKDQFGDACEVCGTVYTPTELIEPDVEVLARGIGNGNAEIGGVARDVPVAQRLLALPGKPFARLVDHLRLQALRGVEPLTQKRDAARVRELEKEVIRGPQLRLCARDG